MFKKFVLFITVMAILIACAGCSGRGEAGVTTEPTSVTAGGTSPGGETEVTEVTEGTEPTDGTEPTEEVGATEGTEPTEGTNPTEPTNPPEHKHSYASKVTKQPTCTEPGVRTYTCSCGKSYTESVKATGHTYKVDSEVKATCTKGGSMVYKCSKCGDTYTKTSDSLGHDWVHHHTDEVGHEEGYFVCHCGGWEWKISQGDFGSSFVDHLDKVLAETGTTAGHSYYSEGRWVIDTPAEDYYICSRCGDRKDS